MASTAIPALEAAILGALQAEPAPEGLEGVSVSGDKEPTRATEYVWLYKAKAKREWRTIGPRPSARDEELRASLRVLVVKGDLAEAKTRALEIAGVVEDALAAVNTTSPLLYPLLVEEIEDEPLQFDQKSGCHVLMTVVTRARI